MYPGPGTTLMRWSARLSLLPLPTNHKLETKVLLVSSIVSIKEQKRAIIRRQTQQAREVQGQPPKDYS
jgi:hypothetical protein